MDENLERDLGPVSPEEKAAVDEYMSSDISRYNQRQLVVLFNQKTPKKNYLDAARVLRAMEDRYAIMFLEEVEDWTSYHLISEKTKPEAIISLLISYEKLEDRIWPAIFVDKLPVDLLPQLKNHPEPIIRRKVAERIDESHLQSMMEDNDTDVRTEVAKRIDPGLLHLMMNDKNRVVRYWVSQRLPLSHLPQMMDDEHMGVRAEVAKRIDPELLPEMLHMEEQHDVLREIMMRIDPDHLVDIIHTEDYELTRIVIDRIDPGYLFYFLQSKDSGHRASAARRCCVEELPALLGDLVESVRVAAYQRIPVELVPKKYLKRWNERNVKMVMGL